LAVLPIVCYEDEILRRVSEPVDEITDEVRELAASLAETMTAFSGVGLAAPQVGENIRLFVLHHELVSGAEEPVAFINPELETSGESYTDREGCLSFPEIYGRVRRLSRAKLRATNLDGEPVEVELIALGARAVQHEIDHLDGILFVDHLGKGQRLLISGKLKQLSARTSRGWRRKIEDEVK
jgi:peptide deformylase